MNDQITLLKEKLKVVPDMKGLELASKVSTKEPYFYGDENATYKISALDIGIKKNILRNLAKRDAYIKVFPYNSKFEDLENTKLPFNPALDSLFAISDLVPLLSIEID